MVSYFSVLKSYRHLQKKKEFSKENFHCIWKEVIQMRDQSTILVRLYRVERSIPQNPWKVNNFNKPYSPLHATV